MQLSNSCCKAGFCAWIHVGNLIDMFASCTKSCRMLPVLKLTLPRCFPSRVRDKHGKPAVPTLSRKDSPQVQGIDSKCEINRDGRRLARQSRFIASSPTSSRHFVLSPNDLLLYLLFTQSLAFLSVPPEKSFCEELLGTSEAAIRSVSA